MSTFKVYSGPEGMVNSTIISLSGQGTILIDTQAEQGAAKEALNMAGDDLLFVFNTHEHFDHTAGNALCGCRIISSSAARQAMEANGMTEGLPNCYFDRHLFMQLGEEEVRIQLFGGHSPGSAVMYLPRMRLLLTGDLIFNGRAPYMAQADFCAWIAALEEMATWDVETVIPGHGPIGGKELLLAQQATLERFISLVSEWKEQGVDEDEMVLLAANAFNVQESWHSMLRAAFERVPGI